MHSRTHRLHTATIASVFACAVIAGSFGACSSDDDTGSATTTSAAGGSGGQGGDPGVGNGGSGGGSGGSGPAALTPETFCSEYASAICTATDGCNCPAVDGAAPCVEKTTNNCEQQLASSIGAIALGDLVFDEASARACVDGAAATLKTCVLPTQFNKPPGCGSQFQNKATLGAACSQFGLGLLCAAGLGRCDINTGKCEPIGKEGEACAGSEHDCAAELICSSTGTCEKPAALGEPCNSPWECASKVCAFETNTCIPPKPKAAGCNEAAECADGLGCIASKCDTALALGEGCQPNECGANNICFDTPGLKTCGAKAKAGEPCQSPDDCAQGTDCDFAKFPNMTCVTTPSLGEACVNACAGGATCNGSICITPPKLNEACAFGGEKPCADGLGCGMGDICVLGGKPGEVCTGTNQACALGAVCDYTTNPQTCKTLGALGDLCGNDDAFCKAEFFCDFQSNTCLAPLALGKACMSPRACEAGSYCQFNVNGGTCVTLPSMLDDSCVDICGGNLRCAGPSGTCELGACVVR